MWPGCAESACTFGTPPRSSGRRRAPGVGTGPGPRLSTARPRTAAERPQHVLPAGSNVRPAATFGTQEVTHRTQSGPRPAPSCAQPARQHSSTDGKPCRELLIRHPRQLRTGRSAGVNAASFSRTSRWQLANSTPATTPTPAAHVTINTAFDIEQRSSTVRPSPERRDPPARHRHRGECGGMRRSPLMVNPTLSVPFER